jgi:hypothetical protein
MATEPPPDHKCEATVVVNLKVSGKDDANADTIPDTVKTWVCGYTKTNLESVIASCLVKIGKHHASFSRAVDDAAARKMLNEELAVFINGTYVAVLAQWALGDLAISDTVFVTLYDADVLPWNAYALNPGVDRNYLFG